MASVTATTKSIRISPRKLRMVANAIKGQKVLPALDGLKYMNRKAAVIVYKTLKSAVANGVNNNNLDAERLVVSRVEVGVATTYKRVRLEAKGRVRRLLKRNSHLFITLTDGTNTPVEAKKTNVGSSHGSTRAAAKTEEAEVVETKKTKTTKPKAAKSKPAAKAKVTKTK